MESKKLIALLDLFADADIESIDIQDDKTVEVDGSEYKILTDEEADEEFRDYQQSLMDDLGIESFTEWAREHILMNFVDEDWFNEAMRESYESYVEDISREGNRLAEEIEEVGAVSEEDYVEHLCSAYDNGIQWYEQNFGLEQLANVVKEQNLLDFDKVVEYVKDCDGRGCIASYDGEEQESGDYFIYQIN